MPTENHKTARDTLALIADRVILCSEKKYNTQIEKVRSVCEGVEKQYHNAAGDFLKSVDSQVIELQHSNGNPLPVVGDSYLEILIRDTALCIHIRMLNRAPGDILDAWDKGSWGMKGKLISIFIRLVTALYIFIGAPLMYAAFGPLGSILWLAILILAIYLYNHARLPKSLL